MEAQIRPRLLGRQKKWGKSCRFLLDKLFFFYILHVANKMAIASRYMRACALHISGNRSEGLGCGAGWLQSGYGETTVNSKCRRQYDNTEHV